MTAIASLRIDSIRRTPDIRREGLADVTLRPTIVADAAPVVGTPPALSALRSAAWFAAWPAPSLSALAAFGSLRSFGPGQTIAAEGTVSTSVALVVKGRVRAVRRAEGGREVTLEVFRAGELCVDALFDETAVLGNDWIAVETSLLLFLPKAELAAQLRAVPEAALTFARDLERRLVRTKQMAAGLALADAQSRLHAILARLAREEGETSAEGTLVRRSPTQQELGNMIGACRETVSRMIADLARRELLSVQGRKMLLSPRFVSELAGREPG